jgi:prepilin peptidase CpaA
MILHLILVPLLLIASVTDVREQRIPNWLTYSVALAALIYRTGAEGTLGFVAGIEGLALGIGCLLPFYMGRGMGAGDVKLMGAVGALLGPKGVWLAFICSSLAGGVYALVLLAHCGRLRDALRDYGAMLAVFFTTGTIVSISPPVRNKPNLRYGIAIAAGTALSCAGNLLHR